MSIDRGKPVLITGGAGFIGINMADRLLSAGRPVIIYDNLARAGVAANLAWLRSKHGAKVESLFADIRDAATLKRVVRRCGQVFHFAAQVAVTTSLVDPITDFEVNARGTLNLLEAIRGMDDPPPLLYTSTNKVYGTLEEIDVSLFDGRYAPTDATIRGRGIGEERRLDFHSPYGCSKGAADQYVLDYARIYDLPAVVFRMSCIYGPHQRGNEDQGWVAHFLLQAMAGRPITIYGDGRQVRDALFVQDLLDAMLAAHDKIDVLSGRAFNIGGGVDNTVSLLELLDHIKALHGSVPAVDFSEWRPADQRYYVSDISSFSEASGWRPRTTVAQGLEALYRDFLEERDRGAPVQDPAVDELAAQSVAAAAR